MTLEALSYVGFSPLRGFYLTRTHVKDRVGGLRLA